MQEAADYGVFYLYPTSQIPAADPAATVMDPLEFPACVSTAIHANWVKPFVLSDRATTATILSRRNPLDDNDLKGTYSADPSVTWQWVLGVCNSAENANVDVIVELTYDVVLSGRQISPVSNN
jgi:hypothetical protein